MTEGNMHWADHVIWWHCYPLGFVGAEPTLAAADGVTHRLGRITGWLDHVVTLGANGVLLAPIFASTSHGYDTLDHYRIDPRLGDDADFDGLIAAARQRGIHILLDGVFNHVSQDHDIVRSALAAGPDSEPGRWIKWSGDHPHGFEGNTDLVELDLTHPPVADLIVDVMAHWLGRGIDGWRLDAAYAPGAEAWRGIVARVKESHPDAWIMAEVIHGPYDEFAAASGVDSVTQYELWKAVWSSFNEKNFHELAWTLGRHAEFVREFLPQTFIGNHDVTRIATQLDDRGAVPLAAALLLLLPGVPSIYAGDEFGFTGEKFHRAGGDDQIRPPFPDGPADIALGHDILGAYRHIISLRRQHPWIARASLEVGEVSNTAITICLASREHTATLRLDVGATPPTWSISFDD